MTVEWSADGSTWNVIGQTSSQNWGYFSTTLMSPAASGPGFRLRIGVNADRTNEYGDFDNVVISGTP